MDTKAKPQTSFDWIHVKKCTLITQGGIRSTPPFYHEEHTLIKHVQTRFLDYEDQLKETWLG